MRLSERNHVQQSGSIHQTLDPEGRLLTKLLTDEAPSTQQHELLTSPVRYYTYLRPDISSGG